jgi:hypothetical protein
MVEFPHMAFLVLVMAFFLFLVAAGLSRLSRKIDAIAARLDEESEPRVENVLAPPRRDVKVHDYHSDEDEFASVTAKAQKAWG